MAFLALTKGFHQWDILAQPIGIAIGTLINYFLNSLLTWKHIEVQDDEV